MPPKSKKSNKKSANSAAVETTEALQAAEIKAQEERETAIKIAKSRDNCEFDFQKLNDKFLEKFNLAFTKAESHQDDTIELQDILNVLRTFGIQCTWEILSSIELIHSLVSQNDLKARITRNETLMVYEQIARPASVYGNVMRKCCAIGDKSQVEDLLKRGCDPERADGHGRSCVHFAAEFGHVEIIQLLQGFIGVGVLDIDEPDKFGWTPLMIAASNGHVETVRWLLEAGADPATQSNNGRTTLHYAATCTEPMIITLLSKSGVNLDCQDDAGLTPLMLAGLHCQVECAKTLLRSGASIQCVDIIHRKAEFWAHPEIRKLLTETSG